MDKSQPFEVPSSRAARGRFIAPPSKSHAIRLVVCQAAAGETWCPFDESAPLGDDVERALRAYDDFHGGAAPRNGAVPRHVELAGPVDLGGSATAFRFFCALAALRIESTTLTGDATLRRRPMDAIVRAVRGLGVRVEPTSRDGTSYAPITVSGGPPQVDRVEVDASRSSHPLSALLLIGPAVEDGLEVSVKGKVASRPYVDLTLWTMRRLGVEVVEKDGVWRVPERRYKGWEFADADSGRDDPRMLVVGDWSGASFLLAAAAVAGEIEVDGLESRSPQADRRIVEILRDFGADVDRTATGVRVRAGERHPLDVDLGDAPDLAPLVGALGCVASGTTRVRGAPHLRHKESDRVAAVVAAARALGCEARELPDGFEIVGPAKHGGVVETHHDHRVAMAFAVAGLAVPGVVIDDPACVAKSYPGFWEEFERLIR
jgi:3-phosphoshikimate 1-carboxyvinyltransferase